VIVSNQDDLSFGEASFQLTRSQYSAVGLKGLVEIAQVFAAAYCIGGADSTFHLRQRMKLGCATPKTKQEVSWHTRTRRP
jgi:hypothetical protein